MAIDLALWGTVGTMQHHRRQEAHTAKCRSLFIRRQKCVEEVPVVALRVIRRFLATGTCHQPQVLSGQSFGAMAVGPAIAHYLIQPEFEQCGHGVPLHRVNQHNEARSRKFFLLGRNIDGVVRVSFIQIAEIHPAYGGCSIAQLAVDVRVAPVRVGCDNVNQW